MKILALDLFLIRPVPDYDWVIYILVLTLLLTVLGRVLFSSNFEALDNVEKYTEVTDNQMLFGMFFQLAFAILVSTVLVDFIIPDYDYIFHSPLLKAVAVTGLLFIFFGARWILGKIINFAFSVQGDRKLNMRVFNYYLAISTVIMWISVLLYYFSPINKVHILIGTGLILLIIRLITYVRIIKNQSLEGMGVWYYNILYLCTLEILPVLVLFKFLIIGN